METHGVKILTVTNISYKKGNVKLYLPRHMGELREYSTHSGPLHKLEVSGHCHALAVLLPEKEPDISVWQEAMWTPEPVYGLKNGERIFIFSFSSSVYCLYDVNGLHMFRC
jgi:hypothetical protein